MTRSKQITVFKKLFWQETKITPSPYKVFLDFQCKICENMHKKYKSLGKNWQGEGRISAFKRIIDCMMYVDNQLNML